MSYELYVDGEYKRSLGSAARIWALISYLENNLIEPVSLLNFLEKQFTAEPQKVVKEIDDMHRTSDSFSILQEISSALRGAKKAEIRQ